MPIEAAPDTLPLFPLPTVLLPGAPLGLRVFEPRYLDMIRECGRNESGFGVCLILEDEGDGKARGAAAAYGTEARIEDFDLGEDGLLTLQVRGTRRFRVRDVRIRDNGLQVARIDWCEPEPVSLLSPEHGLLSTLLRGILERFGGEYAKADQALFDDASWIGWRLAELLPLEDEQRQQLLQIDDPDERLDRLLVLLPDET
ncbi:LON peptidase substrate-binding domain-containing protein [Lysobacter sp. H21R4]|uniref:LON peptidase substrate-binding domain-containing protein n=1 Tax=Lysobacter sp. H21R4 TaxID=2781021 RepID=UPI001888FCDC|nr:LON peptidase substrate-binding domain-containing protein [Lysobacter sp. H21R4]QOY63245.1 LON peptidase substrate-binding domain-containing protein [Lysobacter sp. H21R4]